MNYFLKKINGSLIILLGACSSGSFEIVRPDPSELFDLTFDASTYLVQANFVEEIDNPYFKQATGTMRTFEGLNEDGESVMVTEEVLSDPKAIMGIDCKVVQVKEWENGQLTEETWDYYAQDVDGNVWYFGEEVDNYDNGVLTDHAGAWEGGVDGAIPGIIMPATPQIGLKYRQEFYLNEAEDLAEVISLTENVTIGFGSFTNVLKTKEWTPLEPNSEEYKYYAPGTGLLKVESLSNSSFEELVSQTD